MTYWKKRGKGRPQQKQENLGNKDRNKKYVPFPK